MTFGLMYSPIPVSLTLKEQDSSLVPHYKETINNKLYTYVNRGHTQVFPTVAAHSSLVEEGVFLALEKSNLYHCKRLSDGVFKTASFLSSLMGN